MKKAILIILAIWSQNGFGQCINCTSFEEALIKPEKVKSLKINPWQTDITLDSLPVSIGQFINAEIIYLSDHNFSSIPNEIGNLKKLKELSFAGCKLTEIPNEIFLLKNLKELILLDNQFSEEYVKLIKERLSKEMPRTRLLISAAK